MLNERQAIAGMVRDHDEPREEAEHMWAFASGLADVLFVRGLGSTRIDKARLNREQLEIATLGRVVDLVTRSLGEAGICGPSPRKTDLRVAGRRHSRNPNRSRPHRPHPEPDAATDLERSDSIARAVQGAMTSLPQVDLSRGIAKTWDLFVARLPRVYARLNELATRGREADLFEALQEVDRHRAAAIAALGEVESTADLGQALPHAAPFASHFARALAFLVELASAESADRAEAALDRFRAAVLPK